MAFRTLRDWFLRDRLAALEPQAACPALIFVGQHGSNPFGIFQIHFPFLASGRFNPRDDRLSRANPVAGLG